MILGYESKSLKTSPDVFSFFVRLKGPACFPTIDGALGRRLQDKDGLMDCQGAQEKPTEDLVGVFQRGGPSRAVSNTEFRQGSTQLVLVVLIGPIKTNQRPDKVLIYALSRPPQWSSWGLSRPPYVEAWELQCLQIFFIYIRFLSFPKSSWPSSRQFFRFPLGCTTFRIVLRRFYKTTLMQTKLSFS